MSTTISISVMCSVGSLTCGILSLVLPLIALARRKNALPFAAVSMGMCLLAAVVNAGVCMYQMKRSAKQHPRH